MATRRPALQLALAAVLLAGVATAQPKPQLQPQPAPAPLAPSAPEAPPPLDVPPPEPIAAPPVDPKDVAPAPAPKAKVTEKTVAAPERRARYDVAVLQALDKVTAETLKFEAAVGRPVRWKGLIFTVRACERSASDEAIEDSVAYVTIDSQPRAQPGRLPPPARQAFKGWMYASSPSLHPMEHATYDAWVITCRAAAPAPGAALPPPPARPRPPAAAPPPAPPAPAAPTSPEAPPEPAAHAPASPDSPA